jgi:hypothetical protein
MTHSAGAEHVRPEKLRRPHLIDAILAPEILPPNR